MTKKFKITAELSQVWFEENNVVAKDTWNETHQVTISGCDTTVMGIAAIARLETRMNRKYASKNNEWLFTVDIKGIS